MLKARLAEAAFFPPANGGQKPGFSMGRSQDMHRTVMNILWLVPLLAFSSDALAWQDQSGAAPQTAATFTPCSTRDCPTHHAKQEASLGCFRHDCGRQITSYQAVDLWRGYCSEDCSCKHRGHHLHAGGWPSSFGQIPRRGCGQRLPIRWGSCQPGCDR